MSLHLQSRCDSNRRPLTPPKTARSRTCKYAEICPPDTLNTGRNYKSNLQGKAPTGIVPIVIPEGSYT